MTTLNEPIVIENRVEGWNVEQFDNDGACYMATFTGPDAEKRAREYAEWIEQRAKD